jgi:glutathione S-transferase
LKLYYTPLADYIHRVEIVALEAGIYDDLELVPTVPWESPRALIAANPLRKVPTLVRDDGVAMFGGPVIYEYFDSLHDGPKMFPPSGDTRWTALRLFGLGEGMFDSADLRVVEMRRPDGERSPEAIARYQQAVVRGLDRLEEEAADFAGFHIGLISIAGVLMWIDWLSATRGNQDEWRLGRPKLASWYAGFVDRPSYQRRASLHPTDPAP